MMRREIEIDKKTASSHRAFTLVEVLLVIVIIGVLAGTLVTRLSGRTQDARLARTQADISGLSLALDLFEQDVGRYPTTEEGLYALMANPGESGWKGPYLKTGLRPDPWETPYVYAGDTPEVGFYALSSAGPDRQVGTEDDVSP